jgi:hypothetical protein
VPNVHIGRTVELRVVDGEVLVVFLGEIVATHHLVAPGETSILDDHYGGPRGKPERAARPRTAAEKAFCDLGPMARTFIARAAAAGASTLGRDMEALSQLVAAHDREVLVAALERAVHFGRFRAADVAAIVAAGEGVPRPTEAGQALIIDLPVVPTRSLADYAMGEGR